MGTTQVELMRKWWPSDHQPPVMARRQCAPRNNASYGALSTKWLYLWCEALVCFAVVVADVGVDFEVRF